MVRRPIVVVKDQHHHVLPDLARILCRTRRSAPCTLLHFDSHPDLACLPAGHPRSSALLGALTRGEVDPAALLQACDIASWILPLVLAGHVDTVIWYSAWWCSQMDVGTYRLRVGVVRGRMAVGPQDGRGKCQSCAPYWESDNAWVADDSGAMVARSARPWTLHVCRLSKRNPESPATPGWILPPRDRPWILDVDEDFFTCSNPFRETLRAFLGPQGCRIMKQAYQPSAGTLQDHWNRLRFLMMCRHGRGTTKPPQRVLRALRTSTSVATLRRIVGLLTGVTADRPAVLPMEWLHAAGQGMGLPHHVSTASDISRLLRVIAMVVRGTADHRPLLTTVARSTSDGYVSGSQSPLLHLCVSQFLASLLSP